MGRDRASRAERSQATIEFRKIEIKELTKPDKATPAKVVPTAKDVKNYKAHAGAVNWLSLAGGGKRFFSCSNDGTVREWNLSNGKWRVILAPVFTKGPLKCFAMSPDEKRVAFLNPAGKMSILDLATLTAPSKSGATNIDAAPGFLWSDNDELRFGNSQFWMRVNVLKGFPGGSGLFTGLKPPPTIRSMVFSPDAKRGAALAIDAVVAVFTITQDGNPIPLVKLNIDASTAAFVSDGKLLVLGSADGKLRVHDIPMTTNGPAPEILSWKGHTALVRCVSFTPDGQKIVSGGDDKTVRVWDAVTGGELQRFTHPAAVLSLVVTPDNRHAISAGADGVIRMWSLEK